MTKLIPIYLFLCCSYLANTQILKKSYTTTLYREFQDSMLEKQLELMESVLGVDFNSSRDMSVDEMIEGYIETYDSLFGKKGSLQPLSEVYKLDEAAKVAKEKLEADMTSFLLDDLYVVHKGGKYGLFNKNLEKIVDYNYDFMGLPSDGLVPVQKGNQFGYINYKGKVVIPLQFTEASYFVAGTAKVWTKEYCQIINIKGDVLAQAEEALVWYEGDLSRFTTSYSIDRKSFAAHYITNGYMKLVGGIPFGYHDVNSFSFNENDAIEDVFKDLLLAYNTLLIDANLRVIGIIGRLNRAALEKKIAKDETTDTELCLIKSRFDKTKFFYSYWGAEFTPDRPMFDKIEFLTKDLGIGYLGEKNYILGKDKHPLVNEPFDHYWWFYEQEKTPIAANCIFVKKNNTWGIYKLEKQLYDFQFHHVGYLTNGYFSAALTNEPSKYRVYHLIDGLFSKTSFEKITHKEEEQVYEIIKGGQTASIPKLEDLKNGIDELDWKYVSKWLPIEGMVLVKNPATKKFGYLNSNDKLVIPFLYDAALPFKDGIAKVIKGEKFAYLDKNGKILVESKSPFLKRLGSKYIQERIGDKRNKQNSLIIWNQNKEKVYENEFSQCHSILGDIVVLEKFEIDQSGYKKVINTGLYHLQQQRFIIEPSSLLEIDLNKNYFEVEQYPTLRAAQELVQNMKTDGVQFNENPIQVGSYWNNSLSKKNKLLDVLDLDRTKAEQLAKKYGLVLKSEYTDNMDRDYKLFLKMPSLIQYYDKDGTLLKQQPKSKPIKNKPTIKSSILIYEQEVMGLDYFGDSALVKKMGCKTKDGQLLFAPEFDEIGRWKNGMALALNHLNRSGQKSYILYVNGDIEKLDYQLESSSKRYGDYTIVSIGRNDHFFNLKTKELYAQMPYSSGFNNSDYMLDYYAPDNLMNYNEEKRTFRFNDDFEVVEEDPFLDYDY